MVVDPSQRPALFIAAHLGCGVACRLATLFGTAAPRKNQTRLAAAAPENPGRVPAAARADSGGRGFGTGSIHGTAIRCAGGTAACTGHQGWRNGGAQGAVCDAVVRRGQSPGQSAESGIASARLAGLHPDGWEATEQEANQLEHLPPNLVGCIHMTGRIATPAFTAFATTYFSGD